MIITAELTIDELGAVLAASIEESEAEIEAYEERVCIQGEAIDTSPGAMVGHALRALEEPDTPGGRHRVARAWLREHAPLAGVFRRGEGAA